MNNTKDLFYYLLDAHSKMSAEDFYRHFIDAMPLYELIYKNDIVNSFDAGSVGVAKSGSHYFNLIHKNENVTTI